MTHSFSVELAESLGVDEAIMLQNLIFWIQKNKANGTNMHEIEIDGVLERRTWTYNSAVAWTKLFPYWTTNQIQRILLSLRTKNVIVTGNFSDDPTDRTLWYALVEEDKLLGMPFMETPKSIYGNDKMDFGKHRNVNTDNKQTDSNNTDKILTSSISRVSTREDNNLLREEIADLIDEVLPMGGFTNRALKRDNPAKMYLEVQKFLTLLSNPKLFVHTYGFDQEWLKSSKIDMNYLKGRALAPLVRRAVKRLALMREPGYYPGNKALLPTSLADFFYNFGTKKSWFLQCVFNEPVELKTGVEQVVKLSQDEQTLLLRHKKRDWDKAAYLLKAVRLITWYKNAQADLQAYNYYVMDSMTAWKQRFCELGRFLDVIDEYEKTWESEWSLGNWGLDNKTWKCFVKYCRDTYSVDLEPTKEGVKKAWVLHKNDASMLRRQNSARESTFTNEVQARADEMRDSLLAELEMPAV